MRRILIPASVLTVALAARAFVYLPFDTGRPQHWDLTDPLSHVPEDAYIHVSTNAVNPWTRSVRFYMAEDACTAANRVAELNAVRASFGQWAAVPGTHLRFEEAGLAPAGVDVNGNDGTNVVYWTKNSTWVAGGTANIGRSLGVTFVSTLDDILVGADIVLNADTLYGFPWTTVFDEEASGGPYFIESVLTHELGHFIGLEHSPAGGTTMYYRNTPGIGPQAGLSVDDLRGAQFIYPAEGFSATRAQVHGQVTIGGGPALGAIVTLEDQHGNVAGCTLSLGNGAYRLPLIEPGTYAVRVSPLNPGSLTSYYLARGRDIIFPDFSGAVTGFTPVTNQVAALAAGEDRLLDFALSAGSPLQIVGIRKATTNTATQNLTDNAAKVRVGQSNLIVGVYLNGAVSDASLSISGDGLKATPVSSTSGFPGLTLLSVMLQVSSNAVPGLRSFTVQRGGDLAFANGYLDLQPAFPDYNFDGLDDRFQRQYFPLFTAPEAGPAADPDADGFANQYEYYAGSNPANGQALPSSRILETRLSAQGATLTWQSVPGGRYQVFSRSGFSRDEVWQKLGGPVTASGFTCAFTDATAQGEIRYYEIQLLPQ